MGAPCRASHRVASLLPSADGPFNRRDGNWSRHMLAIGIFAAFLIVMGLLNLVDFGRLD
jgi:hypothetical protein